MTDRLAHPEEVEEDRCEACQRLCKLSDMVLDPLTGDDVCRWCWEEDEE